jgi:Abnormal spindle-like microcephaly-assoc'd, ASPM-SPD-2-Hydin
VQLNASGQGGGTAPALSGLSCASGSITGAGTDSCTVTLSAAAASGGFTVGLASNNSAVTVPAAVIVAAGAASAVFSATISSVSTAQTATLTASAGGVTETFAVQLSAAAAVPVLNGLSCTIGSITGAGSDNCKVTLNAAAPSGGFTVGLASNDSAVTVPATVTLPAGARSSGFTATISSVSTAQTATLTASAGGVTETFAVQLNVAAPGLSINATNIAFGDVDLNTTATQSVTLSSTGTGTVTVTAATVLGTGFSISGSSFPLILSTGQTATIDVEFDPTVAQTDSGTLTVASTSLTSPLTVVSLSGTGVAISYEVDLSWDAPASSADPVAGYNVYRSPSGVSTYVQLNTSAVTQTTYVDTNNILDGQSYNYIVESVDAEGVTSSPSNVAVVPIP